MMQTSFMNVNVDAGVGVRVGGGSVGKEVQLVTGKKSLKAKMTGQLSKYRELIQQLLLTILNSGRSSNAPGQPQVSPTSIMQQILKLDNQLQVSVADRMSAFPPFSFHFFTHLILTPLCFYFSFSQSVVRQKEFHEKIQTLDSHIFLLDHHLQTILRQLHVSERCLSELVEMGHRKVELAHKVQSHPLPIEPLIQYSNLLAHTGGSGAPPNWTEGENLADDRWPFP